MNQTYASIFDLRTTLFFSVVTVDATSLVASGCGSTTSDFTVVFFGFLAVVTFVSTTTSGSGSGSGLDSTTGYFINVEEIKIIL